MEHASPNINDLTTGINFSETQINAESGMFISPHPFTNTRLSAIELRSKWFIESMYNSLSKSERFPKITSLQYVINGKANDTIYDQEVVLYAGRDHIFEEMEGLFKYLDTKKQGKIKRQELLDSISKLRGTQDGKETDDKGTLIKCELKVPNEDDLDNVISTMMLEEEGSLNYDEYLISLFKVTQEGLD